MLGQSYALSRVGWVVTGSGMRKDEECGIVDIGVDRRQVGGKLAPFPKFTGQSRDRHVEDSRA